METRTQHASGLETVRLGMRCRADIAPPDCLCLWLTAGFTGREGDPDIVISFGAARSDSNRGPDVRLAEDPAALHAESPGRRANVAAPHLWV